MKERLDVLLVKRNLADSREKAKALIMSGIVYVNGQKEDKARYHLDEQHYWEVRGKYIKICKPRRPEIREGNDPFRRRVKR